MAAQDVWDSYPFIEPSRFTGKLKGQVVVVTGTSVGIGRAIAKAFAAAGASVACVARREPELKSLVEEIKTAGGQATMIVADVAKRGAAKEIVSEVEKTLGPVDVLVNNAGISRIGAVSDEPEDLDLWWRVYEVNVRAPVSLIRAVLPSMIQRKTGVLITVGSGVATMALPVMTAYASSKAAISKFHENLSIELQGTGIYTYCMCPGRVATELGKPEDAFNKASIEHPATKQFLSTLTGSHSQTGKAELPADTAVAVVAEPRFRVLNGRHFTVGEDVEPIIKELEKPEGGRIGKERLYLVNIGQLRDPPRQG